MTFRNALGMRARSDSLEANPGRTWVHVSSKVVRATRARGTYDWNSLVKFVTTGAQVDSGLDVLHGR